MADPYYFGRLPEKRTTSADSPFRQFIVSCLKCGSVKLRVISEQDEEGGGFKIYLYCPSCRAREELPVK